MFIASLTQWRVIPGVIIGLDYHAVRDVADAMQVKWTDRLLNKIQILELDFMKPGDTKKGLESKPCRSPQVCSMCNKVCSERMPSSS